MAVPVHSFEWLIKLIILFLGVFLTLNSSAQFVSECNRTDSNRHLLFDYSSGNLTYQYKEERSVKSSPCQWFIDGSAFGTNVFLNISEITGECRFENCILVFDGDSLEDTPLAAVKDSLSGAEIVLLSSTPKIFIQIAASCDGLRSFTATFHVVNCTNCSGICLTGKLDRNCDYRCISKCAKNVRTENECSEAVLGCNCRAEDSSGICFEDQNVANHPLWTIVDNSGASQAGHSSVIFNQTLWIFGGYNFTLASDSLIGFSLSSNSWISLNTSESQYFATNPVGRFLHSSSLVNQSLMIFGGVDSKGNFLSDCWLFDFSQMEWNQVENDVVPALAAHSATVVEEKAVYIFGGYTKNGSMSSSIFVWSLLSETWSLEHPRNGDQPLAQMAGHSAVYYAPIESLIIFGGVRSSNSESHAIYLYHLKEQLWTSITQQFAPHTLSPYSQLVFHQANVIGNYMLISGGFDGGNHRMCRQSGIYLYNLDCHVFLKWNLFEEKNLISAFADLNRFGHSANIYQESLVVYGGLSGQLSNAVGIFQLPEFITSQGEHCVKGYSTRDSCQKDPSCAWCSKSLESVEEGICVSHNNIPSFCGSSASNPNCPGLCPLLDTCTSCLAFREGSPCSWCSLGQRCVASAHAKDPCQDKRTREQIGWWGTSPTNVNNLDYCVIPQITSSLTVVLYQPDPDLNMPDEVNFIQTSALSFHPVIRFPPGRNSSDSKGTLVVEMKGFLHPLGANPKSTWDTQLRMWARSGNSMGFDGVAQIFLSKNSDPVNAELVAESRGIFPIKTEITRQDGSPLFPAPDDKYFLKFVYQVTVVKGRLPPDFDIHLYLTWNGNSIVTQPFESKNLEPYTTSEVDCHTASNCRQCLSDASCGWCSAQKRCFPRPTDSSAYSPCTSTDGSPIFLMVDVEQCIDCYLVGDQAVCDNEIHCQWDVASQGCFRRGLLSPTRRLLSQQDCTLKTSCSACIRSPEKCLWCHNLNKCLPPSTTEVFGAFGLCRFWESDQVADPCTECNDMRECQACLSRPTCGWCSPFGKDPRQGTCLSANRSGMNNTEIGICQLNGNDSLTQLWSYSSCPDVDECRLGIADCHVNATCVNTIGSFNCKCSQGYKGDGRSTCVKTCDFPCINGKCSDEISPNIEPFQCLCDLGWTGPQCDVDCGCNFHSTCMKNISQCDQCFGNTEGKFCERCVKGTFGNATADRGCLPCSCNVHADPNKPCDSLTGRCHCEYPYFGRNCEKCPSEFYGDPLNGGICYHKCQSRTLITNATSGGLGVQIGNMEEFCLWILISGKEDYFGDKLPITLTILQPIEINCPENAILIFDGLPSWLASSTNDAASDISPEDLKLLDLWDTLNRPSVALGHICGPLRNPLTFTAKSGIISVALSRSSRSEKFNATYSLSEIDTKKKKKRDVTTNKMNSRVGHSIQVVKNTAFLFAGLDPLNGILNDLWMIDSGSINSSTWTMVDEMSPVKPLPRYFHASCVIGDLILIHGGFVENSDRVQVASDVWILNATSRQWKELIVRNAPALVGHTMTVVKDTIYIIGGASSSFSETIYSYRILEQQWRTFPTNGSRPPGLYGHSATYYALRNAIFVFGGFRFDIDHANMSDTMSVLDLTKRRWIFLPRMQQDLQLTPRMFHAAKYVRAGNYMMIAGGRTLDSLFDESFLVYRFRCNDWLDKTTPGTKTSLRPWFVRFTSTAGNLVYLVSGYSYEEPVMKFSRIPEIDNFCLASDTIESCLSTQGCGFCDSENGNSSFCFDNSGGNMVSCGSKFNIYPGNMCDENLSNMRICREQLECRTCVAPWIGVGEEESRCQWCSNCGNGLCIALFETCETSSTCNRSNAVYRSPGTCPSERCHSAGCQNCISDLRFPCSWTRHFQRASDTVKKFSKVPIFPWNCVSRDTIDKVSAAVDIVEAIPPAECPISCSLLNTCSDCLSSSGSSGGESRCVWSDLNKECLDPNILWLRCPLGNCGVLLYGLTKDKCPKEPSQVSMCRECLKIAKVGWCAAVETNGMGNCMLGGLNGPAFGFCSSGNNVTKMLGSSVEIDRTSEKFVVDSTAVEDLVHHTWHFLTCPPENECLNGHNTCDSNSEDCQDTFEGFNCTCKSGYLMTSSDVDPSKPFQCIPVCPLGCQHGQCVAPARCECEFGFVGPNCSTSCQCNGHSNCPNELKLTTCLKCSNDTYGTYCEKCQDGFVGDARNGGLCQSCSSYCNGHSNMCLTLSQLFNMSSDNSYLPDNPFEGFDFLQLKGVLDRDPNSNLALCYKCDGNTTGYRCDACQHGFFRPPPYSKKDPCRLCECNGHDSTCNSLTGTGCKCANNTATDPSCDGLDKKEHLNGVPCWTVQCAMCKEYFSGRPINGHQCYRQMSVGEDYCFDPEIARGRCSSSESSRPLLPGRTLFFAVQPKYLNVDIRIYIDVTVGGVDIFLSDQDDMFTITVDRSNGFHNVQVDKKYTANSRGIDDIVDFHRVSDLMAYVSASDPKKVVIIRDVRHRLILTIPYIPYELKSSKFYVVIHGIGSPSSDVTRGRILFRQDQPHIDLFVFFSVFFSCFFLFLAICILLWRVKAYYGIRQNRQRVAIELQTMASRPFGVIFLVVDRKVPSSRLVPQVELSPIIAVPEPSTSSGIRRMVPKIRKKKKNIVEPNNSTSARIPAGAVSRKSAKVIPMALEFLNNGIGAVATLPIELPGDFSCPVRFCLGSGLVTVPPSFSDDFKID